MLGSSPAGPSIIRCYVDMWLARRAVPSFEPASSERLVTEPRREQLAFVALACFVAVLAFFGIHEGFGYLTEFRHQISTSFIAFVSLESIAGVTFILALEVFLPAHREQRAISPALFVDGLYVLLQLPLLAGTMALLAFPVERWLQHHAQWIILDPFGSLPWPLTLVLGLMVSDFILWSSHVAKHKVPFFWRFHIIHHSQENLNLFTANRTHPVDSLIEHFVGVIPFFVLFPTIVGQAQHLLLFGLAEAWYIRFQHANIRLNMGPLRYVIVTPQSHRIHHSVDSAHWSTNYANIFCWDRLFGMQHSDITSYPATGLCDPEFPEPERFSPRQIVGSYVRQLVYPFNRRSVLIATGRYQVPAESVAS